MAGHAACVALAARPSLPLLASPWVTSLFPHTYATLVPHLVHHRRLSSHFKRLLAEPGAYGQVGLSDLFELREECLKEFGFSDIYRRVWWACDGLEKAPAVDMQRRMLCSWKNLAQQHPACTLCIQDIYRPLPVS